jgi:hypothetical protein
VEASASKPAAATLEQRVAVIDKEISSRNAKGVKAAIDAVGSALKELMSELADDVLVDKSSGRKDQLLSDIGAELHQKQSNQERRVERSKHPNESKDKDDEADDLDRALASATRGKSSANGGGSLSNFLDESESRRSAKEKKGNPDLAALDYGPAPSMFASKPAKKPEAQAARPAAPANAAAPRAAAAPPTGLPAGDGSLHERPTADRVAGAADRSRETTGRAPAVQPERVERTQPAPADPAREKVQPLSAVQTIAAPRLTPDPRDVRVAAASAGPPRGRIDQGQR